MRIALAGLAVAALTSCSSPDQRKQAALMDLIESRVEMPKGAHPLREYARYYAYENGQVQAEYLIPWKEEPRPGEVCEELSVNFTSRSVPCRKMDDPNALAAGQRRWVPNIRDFPVRTEGGCSVVNILFDPSKSEVKSVSCNEHF